MTQGVKDSRIEWIGEIPLGWETKVLFQIFSQVKCKNTGLVEKNLLSLSYGKIKRKNIDSNEGLLPESFDGYNIIEENDIVLRLTDLQNDHNSLRVGISRERGIVTSAYLTIRPQLNNTKPLFLYYYLHTFDICKGFYGMGAGVRQGLNWDGIKSLQIVLPPLKKQETIAASLNMLSLKIDKVEASIKQAIEEYKAFKQSVITEAVTKGVRGDRPMKDSGVVWFGTIPEEWGVSRVGLHFDIILGKMLCSEPPAESYTLEKYYCAANVHFDGISNAEGLKQMWFSPQEKQLYSVQRGDLLVVEGGAGAGGCAIVTNGSNNTYVQNSIMIVRNRNFHDNRYLRYLIESLVKRGYIDIVCNKATIPHFTKDKLANIPYPVVSESETREIGEYLDSKCAEIDALISAKQQLLTELEAYKQSVIYEYVTGKKEVSVCP